MTLWFPALAKHSKEISNIKGEGHLTKRPHALRRLIARNLTRHIIVSPLSVIR
jgi:hypothetical protein